MKTGGAPIGSTLASRLAVANVPTTKGKSIRLMAEQAEFEHKAKIFKQFNREIGSTTTSVLTTNKIVRVDVVPDDIEEIEETVIRFQLTAGAITNPVEYVPIRIFNHVNALQNKSGGEGEMGKPYGYTLDFMQQMKDVRFLEVRKERLGIDEYFNEGSRLSTNGQVNEHSFSTDGWWIDMPHMNLRHIVKDEIRFEFYFRSDAYRSDYSTAATDAALVDLTDFRMEFFYYAHAMEDEAVWKTHVPSHGISTAFYDITRSTHTFNNATAGQQLELTMNGLSGILAGIFVEIVAAGANGSSPQRGGEQNYLAWDRVYLANSSGQNIQGGQEWTWANMRDYIWPHQFPGSARWIQRYKYAMLIPFSESLAQSLGAGKDKGSHTFDTNQRLFVRMASAGATTSLGWALARMDTGSTAITTTASTGSWRFGWIDPVSKRYEETADIAYNATYLTIKKAIYALKNWDNRATIIIAMHDGTPAELNNSGTATTIPLTAAAFRYMTITFGGAYASNPDISHKNVVLKMSGISNGTYALQPITVAATTGSVTVTAGADGFTSQAIDIRLTGFTYSYIEHTFQNGRSMHSIKRF